MANLRTDNLCGRGDVSVNDGTVWSSFVSGNTLSGYPATNGFNGNTVNDVYGAAGETIVWTAPNGGIRGSKIRIHVYAGNTHPIIMVNGVTTGAIVGSSTPDQRGAWVDVTDITGGVLKTITAVGQTIGGVARQSGWGAVEIDGEILVDSLVGSKGGRSAISGSVYFPGYLDGEKAEYLSIPDTDDLDMGTGDFTFECWVRAAESSGEYAGIFGAYDYDNAALLIQIGNTGKLRIVNPNNIDQEGSTIIIPQDGVMSDWHHIAVTRVSGTIKGYVNGVEEVSHSYSNAIDFCVGGFAVIGVTSIADHPGDYDLKGFISNLRVCKGHTVYGGAFTPPTSPLTVHYTSENDKTSLLCCQDSDDPTQEATGKTISAHGGRYQTGNKNILINGDFSQGTTGFVGDSGASISVNNGVMTVTNGGGDNLYALAQVGVCHIGQKYRCTATITATFSSGNPVFRVRFGGSAESFVQSEATISNGVAFRLDTGEKIADGRRFEIGSGNSSGITQFTVTDLVVTAIDPPLPSKNIPQFGVDAGVTFGGSISMNSSSWMNFPTGTTEERGRGRGVLFGGYSSPTGYIQDIYYLEIQSFGNAVHFGDLTVSRYSAGGCASVTRGLSGGGRKSNGDRINTIEYVEIAITSNSIDFGDLTEAKSHCAACGNQTRGLWMGGVTPTVTDVIEYATIASLGNATDFGNLRAASSAMAVAASPTRALALGGGNPSSFFDYIDYVEIATTGNAQDFGDLTQDRNQNTAVSSNTRAICIGGNRTPAISNVMDYVTISSTGNAIDFGDTLAAYEHTGSVDNAIRGVITGARTPSYLNILESLTIATLGNSQDFGDIPRDNLAYIAGTSDSHGGL